MLEIKEIPQTLCLEHLHGRSSNHSSFSNYGRSAIKHGCRIYETAENSMHNIRIDTNTFVTHICSFVYS
jgi:hypothetical protein